jgi:hypothetical protein
MERGPLQTSGRIPLLPDAVRKHSHDPHLFDAEHLGNLRESFLRMNRPDTRPMVSFGDWCVFTRLLVV